MTQQTDPFGIAKGYDWHNSRKNSRGQNVAAGTGLGAGLNAGVVGGLVAHHGAREAKQGIGALKAMGAAPSRARAAGLIAGHAARKAGPAAAVFGALGGLTGAYAGAISPARRKRRVAKSAFGVELSDDIGKARFDRRKMQLGAHLLIAGKPQYGARLIASGARGMAQDPATQANIHRAALRGAAATGGVGAGALIGSGIARHRKNQSVAKSAFGVELAKADRPSAGRLAAGAAFPGYHGALAGRKGRRVRAGAAEIGGAALGATAGAMGHRSLPGMLVGSALGQAGGAAGATYLANRRGYYRPHRQQVGKSAFGVDLGS